jgi:DNA-3-methyladenine glycosylase II
VAGRTVTWIVPPRLASFPRERAHLEYSSRSLVFAADGSRLLRAWGPPHAPWVLAVGPDGHRWRVEARAVGPREARAAARTLFSLDHPLEAFYRRTRREPVLRGSERRFRGLRLPRDANLYEALLHSIVGQQLSVASASAVKRRLLAGWSTPLEFDGLEIPCVPAPSRLLGAGEAALRSAGLSAAKARSIAALAGWAGSRSLPVRSLARLPLSAAVERLDELPGVGRWTAENALLRAVGRTDVFVAGDLGVRAALDAYGGPPRSAPEPAARAWAERHYPGWGSYATLYLWSQLSHDRRAARGG